MWLQRLWLLNTNYYALYVTSVLSKGFNHCQSDSIHAAKSQCNKFTSG